MWMCCLDLRHFGKVVAVTVDGSNGNGAVVVSLSPLLPAEE